MPVQEFKIEKPRKIIVPLADGLHWRGGGGFLYQEKMDGCFAAHAYGGHILAGEQMPDGRFFAFDCLAVDGQDIRREPLRLRLRELEAAINHQPSTIRPVPTGSGGEFLEAVLARGGEGVVCKALDAPYGEMWACKRVIQLLCRVADFCGGTQSVVIEDAATGQARGKLPLRGGKIDRVRVGSVVKVIGMSLTERGMIREPRICTDTPESWLVKP